MTKEDKRISKLISQKINGGFRVAKEKDLTIGSKVYGAYFSGDFAEGEVVKDMCVKFPYGTTSFDKDMYASHFSTCYSKLLVKTTKL